MSMAAYRDIGNTTSQRPSCITQRIPLGNNYTFDCFLNNLTSIMILSTHTLRRHCLPNTGKIHVLLMRAPSEIYRSVIMAIAIDMVYVSLVLGIWDECFSNEAVNHILGSSAFIPQLNSLVMILVLLILHYCNLVIAIHVMKSLDPSKVRHLVSTLIAHNWLPNFFHNSQTIRSHIRKGRRAVSGLLSMGSYSHLSAYTNIRN